MTYRWFFALGLALASASVGAVARAEEGAAAPAGTPSSAECAQSYEQAQEQRKSGALVAARDTLRLCARDECPGFIRTDCLAWHAEVQAELPTLVLSATSEGRDLTHVTVTEGGGRVLATRLEGQVIELDPGEYDLGFSAPGTQPQTVRFVVARGERNRLLRVELLPIAAAVPAPSRPPPPRFERSLTVPAIFTGVALVGVSGFAALGAWGRSSESKLEGSCAPQCAKDEVAAVRTKYVLADVSLGVGAASLVLAAYTFFRQSPPGPSGATGVGVQAGPQVAGVTYGGRF
ncbi:MAG: hypothetical protein EOO73_15525 [Myxococcales bacterium]|nr:MAG: hypothetical protein EOO73_15525 [Myxococcales bacterium]